MTKDYAYIKIEAHENGDATAYLVQTSDWEFELHALQSGIKADTIHIVSCSRSAIPLGVYQHSMLMVIDDNGKLTRRPLNDVASALYGNPSDFIVGDVIIGWNNPIEECEPDIYPMPSKVAQEVYNAIVKAIIE